MDTIIASILLMIYSSVRFFHVTFSASDKAVPEGIFSGFPLAETVLLPFYRMYFENSIGFFHSFQTFCRY